MGVPSGVAVVHGGAVYSLSASGVYRTSRLSLESSGQCCYATNQGVEVRSIYLKIALFLILSALLHKDIDSVQIPFDTSLYGLRTIS